MQVQKRPFDRWFEVLFVIYAFVSPVSISATNIALGIIYIIGLILLWMKRKEGKVVFNREIALLFIATFVWGAFCTILSGNYIIDDVFDDMWEYTPIVIIPLLLSVLTIKKEDVVTTLLVASSIASFLGILQFFIPAIAYPFPNQLVVDGRLIAFFSHPLHASGFHSITALLALAIILFQESGPGRKAFLWSASILNLTAVVLTMSRSYYISCVLIILILLFVKNWRWMFYGAVGLAVLLMLTISFPNFINTRIQTLEDPNFVSNKERLYIWKSARAMTWEHPVFGVGKGNWWKEAKEKYFPRIEKEYGYKMPDLGHAHNSYLTWSSETGISGLFFYLTFWFFVVRSLYARLCNTVSRTLDNALAAGSLAGIGNLFIAGLFENNLGTAVILLLISMLVGISIDMNREIISKPA